MDKLPILGKVVNEDSLIYFLNNDKEGALVRHIQDVPSRYRIPGQVSNYLAVKDVMSYVPRRILNKFFRIELGFIPTLQATKVTKNDDGSLTETFYTTLRVILQTYLAIVKDLATREIVSYKIISYYLDLIDFVMTSIPDTKGLDELANAVEIENTFKQSLTYRFTDYGNE